MSNVAHKNPYNLPTQRINVVTNTKKVTNTNVMPQADTSKGLERFGFKNVPITTTSAGDSKLKPPSQVG